MKLHTFLVWLSALLLFVAFCFAAIAVKKNFYDEPVTERQDDTTLTALIPAHKPIAEMPNNFKVAFIADQGLNDDSKKVLQMIKAEGTQMVLHAGDFDYADNADAWAKQTDDILGKNFPYLAIIGNHDVKEWDKYQSKITERLANVPGMICKGDIGVEGACLFHGVNFAFSSPGIALPNKIYDHHRVINQFSAKQESTRWTSPAIQVQRVQQNSG